MTLFPKGFLMRFYLTRMAHVLLPPTFSVLSAGMTAAYCYFRCATLSSAEMATAQTRTTSSSRTARARLCGWCCARPSAAPATASWCPSRRFVRLEKTVSSRQAEGTPVGIKSGSRPYTCLVADIRAVPVIFVFACHIFCCFRLY